MANQQSLASQSSFKRTPSKGAHLSLLAAKAKLKAESEPKSEKPRKKNFAPYPLLTQKLKKQAELEGKEFATETLPS